MYISFHPECLVTPFVLRDQPLTFHWMLLSTQYRLSVCHSGSGTNPVYIDILKSFVYEGSIEMVERSGNNPSNYMHTQVVLRQTSISSSLSKIIYTLFSDIISIAGIRVRE
jgi:hypothetical protein